LSYGPKKFLRLIYLRTYPEHGNYLLACRVEKRISCLTFAILEYKMKPVN